jgi:hypothetical protein
VFFVPSDGFQYSPGTRTPSAIAALQSSCACLTQTAAETAAALEKTELMRRGLSSGYGMFNFSKNLINTYYE